MDTETELPFAEVLPPELAADTQAVLLKLTHGTPLNAETLARIRGEAERIRQETFQKHGVLDIGVPAIRELRDA